MELYDDNKKPFWNFLEEDDDWPSPRASTDHPLPTCGSPWSLSPVRTPPRGPPSPTSLPYHCLASLHRRDGNILALAVSNNLIFTSSTTDRIRVWSHPTFLDRGHIRTSRGPVRAMLAHADTLFTAHSDRRVRAWSHSKKVATIPPRNRFSLTRPHHHHHRHDDVITCLALYLREGLLYSASLDTTVRAWKLTQSRCVDRFVAHANALAISQDNGTVFTGSIDGTVKVWRRVYGDYSHAVITVLTFDTSPVNALTIGGGVVYSGCSDGYINVWEKEEGRYRHAGVLRGHRLAVLCLAAVGGTVVSGSEDGNVRVWRREGSGAHACVAVMEGHCVPVRCMAAVEEKERVVVVCSGSGDGMVKVWRVKVMGPAEEKVGPTPSPRRVKVAKEEEEEEVVGPVLSPRWVEKKRVRSGGVPVHDGDELLSFCTILP